MLWHWEIASRRSPLEGPRGQCWFIAPWKQMPNVANPSCCYHNLLFWITLAVPPGFLMLALYVSEMAFAKTRAAQRPCFGLVQLWRHSTSDPRILSWYA